MSIISEALKKTQSQRSGRRTNNVFDLDEHVKKISTIHKTHARKTPKRYRSALVAGIAALFLMAISAGIVYFMFFTQKRPEPAANARGTKPPEHIPPKNVRTPKPADTSLSLNGIMYSSDTPTAIINGRPVKEGTLIQNLTVKKIFPDKVVLSDGEKEITLEVY